MTPARAEEPARPQPVGGAAGRVRIGRLELVCGAAAALLPILLALAAPLLVPQAASGVMALAFGGLAAVLDALMLVAVFVIARIRFQRPRPTRADLRAGFAAVLRHPLLGRVTASAFTGLFFGAVAVTGVPLLVLGELDLGPVVLIAALLAGAVGGIAGVLLSTTLARRIGDGTIIPVACGVAGLTLLLQPLAGTLTDFGLVAHAAKHVAVPLILLGELGSGFGGAIAVSRVVEFRRAICPVRLRTRMTAATRVVMLGALPVGALISGVLAASLGVVSTMWLGAAGVLIATVFVADSSIASITRVARENPTANDGTNGLNGSGSTPPTG